MVYYRKWVNNPTIEVDANSLEGKALKLKRIKAEVDQLNIAYERAQEALTTIMERQKSISKDYALLKKDLVEAALELDDECINDVEQECDCEDKDNCNNK